MYRVFISSFLLSSAFWRPDSKTTLQRDFIENQIEGVKWGDKNIIWRSEGDMPPPPSLVDIMPLDSAHAMAGKQKFVF